MTFGKWVVKILLIVFVVFLALLTAWHCYLILGPFWTPTMYQPDVCGNTSMVFLLGTAIFVTMPFVLLASAAFGSVLWQHRAAKYYAIVQCSGTIVLYLIGFLT